MVPASLTGRDRSPLLRYAIIAAVIAGLAVAAPRYLPDMLSSMLNQDAGPQPKPAEIALPAQVDRLEPVRPSVGRQVTIPADAGGHYVVDATIDGRTVKVMVDTGATIVALTSGTARRLGIFAGALTRRVTTANGIVDAAPVSISEIRVGDISVRNVEAIVIPGDDLAVDLLGMSFLSRLSGFKASDGRLVLVE